MLFVIPIFQKNWRIESKNVISEIFHGCFSKQSSDQWLSELVAHLIVLISYIFIDKLR